MITVRAAVEDDISRIAEIADEVIFSGWTYAYVQERLGRDDTVILVAVEEKIAGQTRNDASIVGFAAFRYVGDDGELLQIAVDPASRRQGVGNCLLSEVLKQVKDTSSTSIFLEVRASNTAAIALYKKHGFEQVRIRKAYYENPTEDAIIFSLLLV